jgi:hypothetical protein
MLGTNHRLLWWRAQNQESDCRQGAGGAETVWGKGRVFQTSLNKDDEKALGEALETQAVA